LNTSGSWYNKGDLRFAQGRRPAADYLRSNPDLAAEVESEVREFTRKNKLAAISTDFEGVEGEEGFVPEEAGDDFSL
jgi:recombination protein RecA